MPIFRLTEWGVAEMGPNLRLNGRPGVDDADACLGRDVRLGQDEHAPDINTVHYLY